MKDVSTNFECFGTLKPISVPMETITVEINDDLFGDFATAFVDEATRLSPLLAREVQLTPEEVKSYISFLVKERVKTIYRKSENWRTLKLMYIPSWVQYNLRMIGECIIRQYGLRVVPEYTQDTITVEEALEISRKIGSFEQFMQIVKDAMPRSPEGDTDVMTTALIAGYMRSIHPVQHPAATYVAGFLSMKLKEEAAFKMLYRIQYDDIEYVRSAILAHKEIYK